jgi:hypothetical protein
MKWPAGIREHRSSLPDPIHSVLNEIDQAKQPALRLEEDVKSGAYILRLFAAKFSTV